MYCRHTVLLWQELTFIDEHRVILKYELPLAEVVENFYDEVRVWATDAQT
jgi:translation elongation factor EF-4